MSKEIETKQIEEGAKPEKTAAAGSY